MKKTNFNLNILTTIFIAALITSNVVAGKIIHTGITLFGAPLTVAGGVFCYPITYLITDIVGELWGKKEANQIVRLGLFGQIAATVIIFATTFTPAIDPAMQEAYRTLLGLNWVFVTGGLLAYLVSQHMDVTVFHKIRDRYIKKHGSTKGGRWIWNNAATMLSQLADTVIFISIAFGLGFGWLWNNPKGLIVMMIGQYALKFILAIIDTPFFYFFTRKRKA